METTLAILLLLSLGLWALAFAFFYRVPRTEEPAPSETTVSIIIPARDEAAALPLLLRSIAAQTHPPLEVIVADDGSSDGTAELAESRGARVIHPGAKPPGWRGKTWPSYRAALEARGELLVFLDADTELAPEGLARLVASHRRQGGGLLSVEPRFLTGRPYEALSAFFNILRAASVGGFGPGGRPHGAFGPCIVISREEYLASGGHGRAEVRGEILESFFLGQALAAEGKTVSCVAGEGALSVRMYPDGLGSLVEGWSKAFVTGASGSKPRFLALSSLWLSGAILAAGLLPLAILAGGPVLGLGLGAYALFAIQIRWMLRRLGRFSPFASLLYPLPLLAFLAIYLRSVYLVRVRGTVTWRGQQIEVGGGPC